jgi:dTDP-4-amino-4,6-dideoxygalactose transaminase
MNPQPATGRRADPLPFALPDLTEEEIAAVVKVLRSGWITTGPEVQAFQKEFAAAVGAPYAIAVNSCTAALHLALEALGIGPGDEVLTTTLTFTATAEVVEYLGARTRFLDVDPQSLDITPELVRAAVAREYVRKAEGLMHRTTGGRLKAIVPVHFGGQICDMPAFVALAAELGVAVVDDAAHALPATWKGKSTGSFQCTTAFSFYATKTLTTGEGGMLTTHDPAVAERARMMALHGISRDAWDRYTVAGSWFYEVVQAGFKYNLTDIAAAMGRVQLKRLVQMRDRRAAIAARYASALAAVGVAELPVAQPGTEHAWHLYPIRLRLDRLQIDRGRFIEELKRRQISTSVHFIPLHGQPFYRNKYSYRPADFPVAEATFPRLVSLPIYSGMTDADVDDVVAAIDDVATTFRA